MTAPKRRRRRYPPSPEEQRDRDAQQRMNLSLLALATVLVLGGGSWYAGARLSPELDDSMCPTDRDIESEVVVALDVTDPWSPLQRQVLMNEFDQIRASLPRFGRIHLFLVTEDEHDLPDPVLSLCNPGDAEDFETVPLIGRWGAHLFANPANLASWRSEFNDALNRQLEGAIESAPGARSPIAEAIWSAGARVFERSTAADKRLIMFSDMLQHTESYSHYRSASWNASDAAEFARNAPARILRGVQVELLLVDRGMGGPGMGPSRLAEFWEEWFAVQGAVVTRIRRI